MKHSLILILLLTSCTFAQHEEQKLVISHLEQNITEIVEAKPVLGASSFYVYKVSFFPQNTFIAEFEDGHIMGYLFAKYSVNNEEVNIERIDEASDTGFDSLMEKYDLNLKNAETYEFSENGWRKASKKNR